MRAHPGVTRMMSRAEGACLGAAAISGAPALLGEGGRTDDTRGAVSSACDESAGWASRGERPPSDNPPYSAAAVTAATAAPHVTTVRRRGLTDGGAASAGARPASAPTN